MICTPQKIGFQKLQLEIESILNCEPQLRSGLFLVSVHAMYVHRTPVGIESNLNEEILAPVSVDDDIKWLGLYFQVTLRLYHTQIHKCKCSNTRIQIRIQAQSLNEEILALVLLDDDIKWLRLYFQASLRLYHIQVHKDKYTNTKLQAKI